MTLEFLTPAAADGAPPAESPMAAAAERSGARLEVRDGWRVPVAFAAQAEERRAAAEAVAFADASAVAKTELQGPPELLAACAGGLVVGTATAHDGAWWCPLTPARALVIGPAPDVEGLHAVDVTSQFCALRIEGPRTRELMARFCALDLRPAVAPPTALRPGSVARTPGLVLVEGADQLLVLVGAALAEYLWTVVSDAAAGLGGRPVGVDTLGGGPLMLEEAATGA
jgi:glycine cleavage system aminomethyltransferase T